jgi:hypothetical protein
MEIIGRSERYFIDRLNTPKDLVLHKKDTQHVTYEDLLVKAV